MKYLLFPVFLAMVGCAGSPSPVLPPVQLQPVKNEFPIHKLWSHSIGKGASDKFLRLTPAYENGLLYAVDHTGAVKAFNTQSRDIKWQLELHRPASSALTLAGELLLLGTSEGEVIALHKDNGEVLWQTSLSSEILAAPKVAKGIVIVRCVNGYLYGLDSKTGKQLWTLEQTTPSLTLRGTSEPVIVDDLVLNSFDNGRLVATNLQTGQIIWQESIAVARGSTDLERMIDADANPVVQKDMVYAVAYQGRLVAMQLGSGRINWTRDIDSYVGLAADPYRLYLTDTQGVIWALDNSTGATLWKQDAMLRRGVTRPLLHKQYLIVGDFNGFLHWFRRDTGKLVARIRLNEFSHSDPGLDESEDLQFPKSNSILVLPVVTDNTLIAMDRHGHTEAFEASYP